MKASNPVSALILTAITGLSLILQFFASIVLASRFGAQMEMDVYLAALTVPTFLITIFAGVFYSCFLPLPSSPESTFHSWQSTHVTSSTAAPGNSGSSWAHRGQACWSARSR